jgi:hypothetical protein
LTEIKLTVDDVPGFRVDIPTFIPGHAEGAIAASLQRESSWVFWKRPRFSGAKNR